MKRYIYNFAFVVLGLLAVSCAQELKDEAPAEAQSVAFVIEGYVPDMSTKTAFQLSTMKYQWSADDVVGIFPSVGYQAVFPMASGAGSSSAVFDGGGWGLKGDALYYAYYPFSKENFESEEMREHVNYTYEGQVASFEDNDLVSLGKYNYMASGASVLNNGTVTFNFKNLGALCRLSFKAPASVSYSKLVISSDNAAFPLTGYFDATDKDGDGEIILEPDAELKSELEILLPEGHQDFMTGDQVVLYFFMPPVDLSSETLTVKLMDKASGFYEMSFTGKNLQAGKAYAFDNNDNSWTEDPANGGGANSGVYLGLMGFNQQLYSYPIGELTSETKAGFDSFIDGLATKPCTFLYYSVDQALTMMQGTKFPDDLNSVAFITFTDGLDQGSLMMNPSYGSDDDYRAAINARLTQEKVAGKGITAYSIGLRGQDVTDVELFQNNLEQLATAPENVYEATTMDELNTILQELAGQLEQTSFVQRLSITIPGQANGSKVRFTLDNITSADNSEQYIEGIFDLTSRSLTDVIYHGLTSTSGTTVKGIVDGIFVNFTFDGVRADNKAVLSGDYIDNWNYDTSISSWRINSEFDRTENTEIVTEKRSMAVMLLLDCSSSLGDDFVTLQEHAKSFIASLLPLQSEPDSANP